MIQQYNCPYMAAPCYDVQSWLNSPARSVTVRGVEVAYCATGIGAQTLIFIGGELDESNGWVQPVEDLAARYRIISIGKERPPLSPTDFNRALLRIMAAEGVDRAIVIGVEWGADAARAFTRAYPHRVTRVIPAGRVFSVLNG